MNAVRAWITLDCAQKLRIRYVLPRPLAAGFPDLFPGAEVAWRRFARIRPDALDHFVVQRAGRFRLAGSAGGRLLTVTFAKGAGVERGRGEVEAALAAAGFPAIRYERAPAAQPDSR